VPVTGADELGGWRLVRGDADVRLDGSGDPVDGLRLLCGATWSGTAVDDVRAGSDEARELLTGWGLKG
jgi:glycerol-1-phosphatase